MKLDIQLFGGRGASSSNKVKSSSKIRGTQTKEQEKTKAGNFSNRKNTVNFVKEQIDVDLNKAATERQGSPRRGLNIDGRKLDRNEFATLRTFLNKKNIRFESNGVYDYFVWFKNTFFGDECCYE